MMSSFIKYIHLPGKCLFIVISFLILVLHPMSVSGQGQVGGNSGSQGQVGGNSGQVTTQTVELKNPLKVDNIESLIEGILNIVLILSVPVIVFFIIYAGFLYVTARGNAEQVKKATTALTYAIIGGVLIIGAVAIAEIVKELVLEFSNES